MGSLQFLHAWAYCTRLDNCQRFGNSWRVQHKIHAIWVNEPALWRSESLLVAGKNVPVIVAPRCVTCNMYQHTCTCDT